MLSTKIELSKRNFPNKDVTDYLETSDIKDFTYDLSIKDFADYLRVIPYKVTNCFERAKKQESKLIESIKKSKNVFTLNFASDFYSHLYHSKIEDKNTAYCFYYTNEDYKKYYNYINDITTNSGIYYFICANMNNSEHTNLLVVEKKEDGEKIFYSLDVNPLINTLVTYNLRREVEYVLLPDDDIEYDGYDKISNNFIDILEKCENYFYDSISEKTIEAVGKLIYCYMNTNPNNKINDLNISIVDEKIRERFKKAIEETYQFISEQEEDISKKSFAEFLIGKGHQVRANGFFITMNENSDKNCVDRVIELIDTLLKDENKENVIKLLNEATFELNENGLDKFKKAAILNKYEAFKKYYNAPGKINEILQKYKINANKKIANKIFKKISSNALSRINKFLQKYKFNENKEFVNDILNKKYSELFKEEILKSGKSKLIQKITDEENKQYLENLESEYNELKEKEKENSIYESASKPVVLSENLKEEKVNEDEKIIDNEKTGSHQKANKEKKIINNKQIGSHQKAELKRREEKNSQLQQGNQLQQGEN